MGEAPPPKPEEVAAPHGPTTETAPPAAAETAETAPAATGAKEEDAAPEAPHEPAENLIEDTPALFSSVPLPLDADNLQCGLIA